jgi:hypothetical protein
MAKKLIVQQDVQEIIKKYQHFLNHTNELQQTPHKQIASSSSTNKSIYSTPSIGTTSLNSSGTNSVSKAASTPVVVAPSISTQTPRVTSQSATLQTASASASFQRHSTTTTTSTSTVEKPPSAKPTSITLTKQFGKFREFSYKIIRRSETLC